VLTALLLAALPFPQEAAVTPEGGWTWDDFPVFVWRQRYRGKELPEELIAPFGGTNVFGDEEAEWVREKGYAFYVTNAAGRNDLHLDADEAWGSRVSKWMETRDPAFLVREPCLSDPETLDRLNATLDRTLAARAGDHGFGLSLGDEVSLTPSGHPFDLCRSAQCEASWRKFAERRGLPERSPLTDDVRAALAEGDFSLLGGWLGRRRFHREQLEDVLVSLAERGPEESWGLLGITPSSAFGGVDLSIRLADHLDFVECYPVLDGPLMAPSRGLREQLGTVFLQEGSPDDVARQVWQHWMRGARGLVLWSDALLEDRSPVAQRVAQTVAFIRRIQREHRHLRSHVTTRVAILRDSDSIAASWLRDALLDGPTWPQRLPTHQRENGSYEQSINRWMEAFETRGLVPRVQTFPFHSPAKVSLELLVLPSILVLDEVDVRALEGLVDSGVTLVVDGELGWVDRRGAPWKDDVFERLQRRSPEHVRLLPRGHHPSSFLNRLTVPVERQVDHVRISISSGEPPLLLSRRQESRRCGWDDIEVLYGALPASEGDARSHLLSIDVPAEEGWSSAVEWIQPASPDTPLRPGDAALFAVRWTFDSPADD
jgi:hypothetical protein